MNKRHYSIYHFDMECGVVVNETREVAKAVKEIGVIQSADFDALDSLAATKRLLAWYAVIQEASAPKIDHIRAIYNSVVESYGKYVAKSIPAHYTRNIKNFGTPSYSGYERVDEQVDEYVTLLSDEDEHILADANKIVPTFDVGVTKILER